MWSEWNWCNNCLSVNLGMHRKHPLYLARSCIADVPCHMMGPSGNSHHKTVAPAWICAGLTKINIVMFHHDKSWRQYTILEKKSEATLKIGYNNIKAQVLFNIDKTRSKHGRSQFPCHTLLINDSEHSVHVKFSLYSVIEPVHKLYQWIIIHYL